MGATKGAHTSKKIKPWNIYAMDEHTATAKFYPRENFLLE